MPLTTNRTVKYNSIGLPATILCFYVGLHVGLSYLARRLTVGLLIIFAVASMNERKRWAFHILQGEK